MNFSKNSILSENALPHVPIFCAKRQALFNYIQKCILGPSPAVYCRRALEVILHREDGHFGPTNLSQWYTLYGVRATQYSAV